MYTGKSLKNSLETHGWQIMDSKDRKYWETDWANLNQVQRSGTASVFFTGSVMTDSVETYHTFCIHPVGEPFDPYSVAISTKD